MTREELIARRDELAVKEAGIRQQQNDLEVARVLAVGARMEVERMLRVEEEKETAHGDTLEPPDESGNHGAAGAARVDAPDDAAEPVGASCGYAI
jgi:hypothetical protein